MLPKKITVMVSVAMVASALFAEDWPQWRYDSRHSATTTEQLPSDLHLQWVRDEGKPVPAWDNQKEVNSYGGPGQPIPQRVGFDIAYQPVVAGTTAFYNSSNCDWVKAVDIATGSEIWRFYTGGPVRFAPAYSDGKLYFGSDDGMFYCVDATSGAPVWKYATGPDNRMVMGNDRLVSKWMVRGAPVIPIGTQTISAAGVDAWRERLNAATNEFAIATAS
ncbi:MAG: PQQ-like beta-propeller repeat protein, partial [Chitinispirillaceae bacterium]|nr:PQQ-like beta-propeller repeat protein [Chitinispirillaceae bacterium]